MDLKFSFNLKKAQIYQTIKWSRLQVFSLAKAFKRIFFLLLIFDFLLFLYGFLGSNFSDRSNATLLGFFLIFAALSIGFWLEISFFNLKLKKPKLTLAINDALDGVKRINLAEFFLRSI